MMNHSLRFACLLLLMGGLFHSNALAQIQFGGLLDLELRKGGADSSPYINQTPGDKLSLYTPNIRLFIGSNISEKWFVNAILQSDHYNGKELSSPFFSVLNVNFTPDPDSDLLFTAGRFVTPYGSYSNRLLSSDNPFVHLPMTHATGLPLSKRLGFLSSYSADPAMTESVYGEGETGLTMVYQRMYTQGLKVSGTIGESGWLGYDLAATLAPASSHFEYSEYDSPAITGRMILKPVIWAELGLSYSTGSFLKKDAANDSLLVYQLSSYKQELMGADLKFSYRYYTLWLEYNKSFWKAPYYDPMTSNSDARRTGKASIDHISGEFVFNFPFIAGGYAGLRYEQMNAGEIEIYITDVERTNRDWTYDRTRVEFVGGYKLDRNIIMKASYLYSDDNGPSFNDNVFSIQLSVLF